MNICATCRHWRDDDGRHNGITHPYDPDTYAEMKMPFPVLRCTHPKLLFCERPVERDGFAVADGSTYFAALYTGPSFGCVRHEALT